MPQRKYSKEQGKVSKANPRVILPITCDMYQETATDRGAIAPLFPNQSQSLQVIGNRASLPRRQHLRQSGGNVLDVIGA